MTMRLLFVLFLVGTLAVGCSSSDGGPAKQDGTVAQDAGSENGLWPDLTTDTPPSPDTMPLEQNVGEACTDGSECKPGSPNCVEGICSITCVPDNPATAFNEDSCPDNVKQICSYVFVNDVEAQYCLVRCTPDENSNPCPAGSDTACSPRSTYFTEDLSIAACWIASCKTGSDCPVLLATECQSDAECDTANGQFCEVESGLCALPGNCNTANGLCGVHTHGKADAKIGDPCKDSTECAGDQYCDREYVDDITGDVYMRNGYCTKIGCMFEATLTSAACPAGSGCNRAYFGGLCQRECTLDDANSCRGLTGDMLGDYECYAWQNVGEETFDYSDGPLCDYAPYTPCDYVDSCEDIGDATNSTNMSCRNPKTNEPTVDPNDPNGYCLDDTASGPLAPSTI
ncbi:MAG: hypothetical protein V1754_08510 [Pseudomonadota bacterium]